MNFKYQGEPPVALVDAVRSSASAVMSLLNLLTGDFLAPSVPFQMRLSLPDGKNQMDTKLSIQIQERHVVSYIQLEPLLRRIAGTLNGSSYGPKLTTALELYAAHVNERQARVRFLLLMVALETLARATKKHDVAMSLLARWKSELDIERRQYITDSEEWMSLDALDREINFRREDSIRTQVRKLFAELAGYDAAERMSLQKRALSTYDRRSVLVHDGYLPADELAHLEDEARKLLEVLLKAAIADDRPSTEGTSGA